MTKNKPNNLIGTFELSQILNIGQNSVRKIATKIYHNKSISAPEKPIKDNKNHWKFTPKAVKKARRYQLSSYNHRSQGGYKSALQSNTGAQELHSQLEIEKYKNKILVNQLNKMQKQNQQYFQKLVEINKKVTNYLENEQKLRLADKKNQQKQIENNGVTSKHWWKFWR